MNDLGMCHFRQAAAEEIQHLSAMYQEHGDRISAGATMPKPVNDAVAVFEALLTARIYERHMYLQSSVLAQHPQFQHLYTRGRAKLTGANRTYIAIFRPKTKGSHLADPDLYRLDRLWWILNELLLSPTGLQYRHSLLLALLDDYSRDTKNKKGPHLDQILYDRLPDLIALLELLLMLRMQRPHHIPRDVLTVKKTNDRIAWRSMRLTDTDER
jgi:hypothetical protein